MDFLMRPVLAGLVPYQDVVRPGLDLYDFAVMNDALNVQAENERRLEEK